MPSKKEQDIQKLDESKHDAEQFDEYTKDLIRNAVKLIIPEVFSQSKADDILKHLRETQIQHDLTNNNLNNLSLENSEIKKLLLDNSKLNSLKNDISENISKSKNDLSKQIKNFSLSTESISEEISALRMVLEVLSGDSKKLESRIIQNISQTLNNNKPTKIEIPQINTSEIISKISGNVSNNISANISEQVKNILELLQHYEHINERKNTRENFEELPTLINLTRKIIDELDSLKTKINTLEFTNSKSNRNTNSNTELNIEKIEKIIEKYTKNITFTKSDNPEKNTNDSINYIESILRSNSLSQTKELESFSNEITSITEQNSLLITNKIKEDTSNIISLESQKFSQNISNNIEFLHSIKDEILQIKAFIKKVFFISCGSLFIMLIVLLVLILKN